MNTYRSQCSQKRCGGGLASERHGCYGTSPCLCCRGQCEANCLKLEVNAMNESESCKARGLFVVRRPDFDLLLSLLDRIIASAMGFHQLYRPRRRVVTAALTAVAIPLESSSLLSTIVGIRSIASCAAFELPRTQHLPPRSDDGSTIAYIHHEPPSPAQNLGLVFFPGFLSNMHSSKACRVFRYAQEHNLECTLFDRYGHGASRPHYTSPEYDGRRATMGRWLEDSLAVLDNVTTSSRKQILIGSSMGMWLAILAGINRPERVAGILGIASAPDYTALLRKQIGEKEDWSQQLRELGYVDVPTIYDRRGYYRLHEELIVEGDAHLILPEESTSLSDLPRNIPVRLVHGMADTDIPFKYSQSLAHKLETSCCSDNVRLDLIQGGDHRLSSPERLEVIENVLEEIVGEAGKLC